jgi:Mg2+/Co2+ transporter CorB
MEQVLQHPYTRYPVYDDEFDNVLGVLHVRRLFVAIQNGAAASSDLRGLLYPAHLVPKTKRLGHLLTEIRRQKGHMAIVVDEYGSVAGLVTLEDLLEEIVGEFTTDPATITHKDVHTERPGVFIVNASATIRALNRALGWQLPIGGPKTVNGLLLEHLETIPDPGAMVRVGNYEFEVLQLADNAIRTVRVRAPQAEKAAAAPAS